MDIKRPTTEFMTGEVLKWLYDSTDEQFEQFIGTERSRLVGYHHSLGQKIRNEFELWKYDWTPDIRDHTDYAKEHPDQISMRVIEAVWDEANRS